MRVNIGRLMFWFCGASVCYLSSSLSATDIDTVNIPSPITAIEEIGNSLNSGKDREKALRAQVKDLTSEIISISGKIRYLRELIQQKEIRIGEIKLELEEVEEPYYVGEEGILLFEHGLRASIVSLF